MLGEFIFSSFAYIFLFLVYFFFFSKIKDIFTRLFFFTLFLVFFNGFFLKSLLYFFEFYKFETLSNLTSEYISFDYDLFLNANFLSLGILFLVTIFITIYTYSSFNKKTVFCFSTAPSFWLSDGLFYFIFIAFVVIKIVQYKLGLGIMGSDNVVLPFHLHSFIFRVQGYVFIPLMLNSLLHRFSYFKMFFFAICLLSGILFGSKSGIYFVLLYLAAILYFNSLLKFKFLFFSFLSIPFLLLFYWLGNFFRGVDNFDGFELVDLGNSFLNSSEVWIYIFKASLNRFIGLDGIMYYLNFDGTITLAQLFNFKLFFTYDIVGVQHPNDFRSPGFFTILLFRSPSYLVLLFPFTLFSIVFIFLIFVKYYFNKFIGYKLFVLYSLYGVFSEGYLQIEDIISLIISFLIVRIIDSVVKNVNKSAFKLS